MNFPRTAMRTVILAAGLLAPALPAQDKPPLDATLYPELMNKEISASLQRGLTALTKLQQADGRFNSNWEGGNYVACMTSVAGLAFLASGSNPEEGPYAAHARKAMLFLLSLAESRTDGLIAGADEYRCTYGHGYSMLFLGQCYGMEPSLEYERRIRKVLERAIELVGRGQSKEGGWLYHPAGGGDEGSTTSVVLQGLRACRNAGIKVPMEIIEKAVAYLKKCQNPDGGIFYSLGSRGASSPILSAAAIACFYSMGLYDRKAGGKNPEEAAMVDRLIRFVDKHTNKSDTVYGHYFYHNFYMGQSMYQRGREDFRSYYPGIARNLVKNQKADGTWIEEGVGPVYGTAMACIILQFPYGYLPIAER